MPQYTLFKATDLLPGNCRTIEVDGRDIAVYNVDGTYYATDDFCKHRGGHLGEGHLLGHTVTCPLHFWQYDITTGECTSHPNGDVRSYPVTVEEGALILTADPPFEKWF